MKNFHVNIPVFVAHSCMRSLVTPLPPQTITTFFLCLLESIFRSYIKDKAAPLKHVIVVAHSTGGMYVLSIPKIENLLDGLILLDSAPNAEWQISFGKVLKDFPVPGLEVLQEKYRKSPSNEALKKLTIGSAPYLFTEKGLTTGIKMLESLPCEES